jgi:hypothetical protein
MSSGSGRYSGKAYAAENHDPFGMTDEEALELMGPVTSDLPQGLVQKSEKMKMYEFFSGKTTEVSQIILRGLCPKCHSCNRTTEWKLVGLGYKQCDHCGWRDY